MVTEIAAFFEKICVKAAGRFFPSIISYFLLFRYAPIKLSLKAMARCT